MLLQLFTTNYLFAYLVLGYTTNILYQEYFDYDSSYEQTLVVILWPGAIIILTLFMLIDGANVVKSIIKRFRDI